MENLTHLMQLIDANSDNLSEGVYLEMCNSIKGVHKYIHSEDNDDNNYICLLYTSPSPRDVEESRMPSSA